MPIVRTPEPFEHLFQHIKQTDVRLYEALKKISARLRTDATDINENAVWNQGDKDAGVETHVIGFDMHDCTLGIDVSDPVIPFAFKPTKCKIRVHVADAVPLEVDVKQNGVTIFDVKPIVPALSNRTVQSFPLRKGIDILADDDVTIDVTQGSEIWEVVVYIE